MNNATIPVPETSGTSNATIMACNAISIAACASTLALYFTLLSTSKYRRLMRRTSLVLAACMASSDLVLHCANLAGYGPLPEGFLCAWVGGFLFAGPSMLSIFYSCCIALNSQLAFVLHRRPSARALKYYVVLPFILMMIISCSALATGSFGYDQSWGYCWYNTVNVPPDLVLIRIIFTYSLPTLLCILYLVFATITITFAVFGKYGPFRYRDGSPSPSSPRRPSTERAVGDSARRNAPKSSPPPVPTSGGAKPTADPTRVDDAGCDKGPNERPSIAGSPLYPINVYPPTSPGVTPDTDVDARSSEHHTFPPLSVFALQQDGKILRAPHKGSQRGLLAMLIKSKMATAHSQDASYTKEAKHAPEDTKDSASVRVGGAPKTSMKDVVVRQLTFRLIGYIVAPILCLLPGIILDLVAKVFPKLVVPSSLNGLLDGLNGLIGLFNSILMLSDPSLLAVWNDVRVRSARQFNPIRRVLGLGSRNGERIEEVAEAVDDSQRQAEARVAVDNSIFARTRRDEEEGEEYEEAKAEDANESLQVNVEEHKRGRSPFAKRGRPRAPLQVHVQVNVTQRVMKRQSRVELMENWLSGL